MSQPLHIAISARSMSHPYGGVKESVVAMTRALLKLESRHRFSVYYSSADLIGSNPQANEVYLSAPHKLIWDHWTLPRCLERDRPDVVWFPQNVSSLGLLLPTVVTVNDLLYFRLPEFPFREYRWLDIVYMRVLIPYSLRRAHNVVTISNWTAHDAERLLGIRRGKLKTIYLAPGSEFKPLPEKERTAVRAKYKLLRPFFFYAGTMSVRKNVRLLIEAFAQVQAEIPHELVLTGGGGDVVVEVPIDALMARHGIQHRVRQLGVVPKQDLVALYNAADAFVFPSLYEGFGLPPLEAFACACPVVSSSATSLSEVVGEAALTFHPADVETLALHLKAVATDPGLRARLAQLGLERAQRFSWERSAAQLLELLEDAATSSRAGQSQGGGPDHGR